MRELAWRLIAWAIVRPRVFAWMRDRGLRTPYSHIRSADKTDIYMYRFWLFNPYGKDAAGEITPPRWEWLPSIRLHCIMRPDYDDHPHDHPWNARTIILNGEYAEEREVDPAKISGPYTALYYGKDDIREAHTRQAGYTGRLLFGEYHRITRVSLGGVWTLFITWKKRGSWGFKVNGVKVPWREYLNVNK